MYGYYVQKSFSLVELSLYVVAIGILVSIITGGIRLIENAKTQKIIDEIEYYNRANNEFVIKYGALPGLLSEEKCKFFDEFRDYCLNEDSINTVTSENLFKNEDCDNDIGCLIISDTVFGEETVIKNFLTPMRYLKQAGLIDGTNFSLKTVITCPNLEERQCDEWQYSKRVWAVSRAISNVYINIYNYYNKKGFENIPFLFNGQRIMGHTIESGTAYDHYDKLVKTRGQYLIYHTLSKAQKEVANVNVVEKIDKKIDDGRPLTGKFTTYSTSSFANFNKSNYSKCITIEPNNKEAITKAMYSTTTHYGTCSFIYLLDDVYDFIRQPL